MSRIKRIVKLKSRMEAAKKSWRTRKKQLTARGKKKPKPRQPVPGLNIESETAGE